MNKEEQNEKKDGEPFTVKPLEGKMALSPLDISQQQERDVVIYAASDALFYIESGFLQMRVLGEGLPYMAKGVWTIPVKAELQMEDGLTKITIEASKENKICCTPTTLSFPVYNKTAPFSIMDGCKAVVSLRHGRIQIDAVDPEDETRNRCYSELEMLYCYVHKSELACALEGHVRAFRADGSLSLP